MKTFVRCGQLFTGRDDEALKNAALVYDESGRLTYAGAEKPPTLPPAAKTRWQGMKRATGFWAIA